MRAIQVLILLILVVFPQANMFASNEPFYKNFDYSNIDFIGIMKNKGKGEYKLRTVQPLVLTKIMVIQFSYKVWLEILVSLENIELGQT